MVKERGVVIADAGPLIAFGKIKQISLLTNTLGKLLVSQTVREECTRDISLSGAKEINEAMTNGLISVYKDPHHIGEQQELFDILGRGEATAILLAKQLNAGLLIDERLGRQIANQMKLKVIGTAGVLVVAKQNGLIKNIKPLLIELRKVGYYLSDELIR